MKRLVLIFISLLCLGVTSAIGQSKTYPFKAGYNVTCTLDKKVIAEGTDFLALDGNGDMIISGKVKSSAPLLVVSGDHAFKEGDITVVESGDFTVINSSDGTFITNGKKGEALKIRPQKIEGATFKDDSRTVTYSDSDGSTMMLKIAWKPSNSNSYYKKESLSVRVENDLVAKYGYADTKSILGQTPSGYNFVWTNGYSFVGDIDCREHSDGTFYRMGLGKEIYPNLTQSIVRSNTPGYYTYTRETINDPNASVTKMVIEVPESVIVENGFWNPVAIINKGKKGTFTFKNGDVFDGEYTAPVQNGGIGSMTFGKGTYRWYSGDVFKGDYSGRFVGGVPIDGELVLSDGQSPMDNWWESYKLSQDDWKQFEQYQTPTEKFGFAMSVFAADLINSKIQEVNNLLDKGKYADALKILKEYRRIAETTTVAKSWNETLTQIDQELRRTVIKQIADLLIQKNYDAAINLAAQDMGWKNVPNGSNKYEGLLNYEQFLADSQYRFITIAEDTGASTYYYNTVNGQRVRQGYFDFDNGALGFYGYYNNGKMDGPWLFISNNCEGFDSVTLQCYKNGVPDGHFIYVRDGRLSKYCEIRNGVVSSDFYYWGKTYHVNYAGLLEDTFSQKEEVRHLPYVYEFQFLGGKIISIRKIDDSLGTSKSLKARYGFRHKNRSYHLLTGGHDMHPAPSPDMIDIHYGMLIGVKPLFYEFDDWLSED